MTDQPQPTPAVEVAVLVLTFNQREMTLRCLSSVLAQAGPTYRVVLWDNGSEDGTVEAVRRQFPQVWTHYHPENLGVASGRNAAAALAIESIMPTYLLFLDNDMILRDGFIGALQRPLAERPELGQTQAKLLCIEDPERINDGGGCRISYWRGRTHPVGFGEIDRGQHDRPKPCIACGGAMMTRTHVFQELGGFDSIFDPVGPEDLDFSLRLQKAGYQALYIPQAVALHADSHTFGGGRYTELYARHKARNWIQFLLRHAPWYQRLAFVFLSGPLLALRLLIREGRTGNLGAIRGTTGGLMEVFRQRRRR